MLSKKSIFGVFLFFQKSQKIAKNLQKIGDPWICDPWLKWKRLVLHVPLVTLNLHGSGAVVT